jgi:hypothetical protein
VRYERRVDIHQAFVDLGCILICYKTLIGSLCWRLLVSRQTFNNVAKSQLAAMLYVTNPKPNDPGAVGVGSARHPAANAVEPRNPRRVMVVIFCLSGYDCIRRGAHRFLNNPAGMQTIRFQRATL